MPLAIALVPQKMFLLKFKIFLIEVPISSYKTQVSGLATPYSPLQYQGIDRINPAAGSVIAHPRWCCPAFPQACAPEGVAAGRRLHCCSDQIYWRPSFLLVCCQDGWRFASQASSWDAWWWGWCGGTSLRLLGGLSTGRATWFQSPYRHHLLTVELLHPAVVHPLQKPADLNPVSLVFGWVCRPRVLWHTLGTCAEPLPSHRCRLASNPGPGCCCLNLVQAMRVWLFDILWVWRWPPNHQQETLVDDVKDLCCNGSGWLPGILQSLKDQRHLTAGPTKDSEYYAFSSKCTNKLIDHLENDSMHAQGPYNLT